MEDLKVRRVRLTKLRDCDNPGITGNIKDGHVVEGDFVYEPVVGHVFLVDHYDPAAPFYQWHTSEIKKIIDGNTFRTRNSIYRWEFIDEPKSKSSKLGEQFVPYTKEVLISKIHNAKVKEADLRYEGSVTIGGALMKDAGLKTYDKVMVVNLSNGARIETYVIDGIYREVKLNGAAARQFASDDRVIIMQFATVSVVSADQPNPKPTIVILDGDTNLVKEIR